MLNSSDYNQPGLASVPVSWYRKKWGKALIIFFILLGALLVAGIYLFFDLINNPVPEQAAQIDPAQILEENLAVAGRRTERDLAEKIDRPSFGNAEAKVVIVEFSDFQCPVCQTEFPIIRKVMNNRQDEIFFIYRSFPTINENSILVAMASYCAWEQDKFWPLHDKLFLSGQNDFNRESLIAIARQSGLDQQQFSVCLDEEKYLSRVLDDVKDAASLGVVGTPTFFINGNKLAGAISEEQWQQLIDYSLSILEQNN